MVLQEKILNPGFELSESKVVAAIMKLLSGDGF